MICQSWLGDVIALTLIVFMLLTFIKSVGQHTHVEVEGAKVRVKPWYVRWFLCYHLWAVHLPHDCGWICIKCGGRQYAE